MSRLIFVRVWLVVVGGGGGGVHIHDLFLTLKTNSKRKLLNGDEALILHRSSFTLISLVRCLSWFTPKFPLQMGMVITVLQMGLLLHCYRWGWLLHCYR